MSIPDAGLGNQYEALRPPSAEDAQKTGAYVTMQESLGGRKANDTLVATPSQEHSLWKTHSDSNKPTLSSPLSQLRIGKEYETPLQNTWMEKFITNLPLDIQQKLQENSKLPLEERDSVYQTLFVALENISLLFSVITQIEPKKIDFDNTSFFSSLKEIEKTSKEETKNILDALGPNTPFFDDLMQKFNRLKK